MLVCVIGTEQELPADFEIGSAEAGSFETVGEEIVRFGG